MASQQTLEYLLNLPMRGRFLCAREIAMRTGRTVPAIYRWEREGTFPRRVKMGARAVGWRGDEVADWFDARERVE